MKQKVVRSSVFLFRKILHQNFLKWVNYIEFLVVKCIKLTFEASQNQAKPLIFRYKVEESYEMAYKLI